MFSCGLLADEGARLTAVGTLALYHVFRGLALAELYHGIAAAVYTDDVDIVCRSGPIGHVEKNLTWESNIPLSCDTIWGSLPVEYGKKSDRHSQHAKDYVRDSLRHECRRGEVTLYVLLPEDNTGMTPECRKLGQMPACYATLRC
jgi:hypothetical protein